MQRVNPLVLLVLALVCGGVAAYMAASWLKASSHRAQQAAQQTVTMTPRSRPVRGGCTTPRRTAR